MSLLEIAKKFSDYVPEPFVAPIPTNGVVDVFALQNNVPLRYTLRGMPIGWWEIVPTNHKAVLGRLAYFKEIEEYLVQLPRFYAIVGIPSGQNSWLVFPYNSSDAAQRGWKNGEPKEVYLVGDTIEPFDVIITRKLGDILIYQGMDMRLGEHSKSEGKRDALANKIPSFGEGSWGNAYDMVADWYKKVEQDAIVARLETQAMDATERMKFMLEFMGASLVSAKKSGNGYTVVWKAPDGHTYQMGVHENGRIAVAGFCLAGTDEDHNLSSIVQVMEEAHKRNRPDVEQAYADY